MVAYSSNRLPPMFLIGVAMALCATFPLFAVQSEPAAQTESADWRLSEQMRERLDEGRNAEALVLARRLMHSKEKNVRRRTADALGWIGRKAMPELVEMLGDEDPDVVSDALAGWQLSYVEQKSDEDRIAGITNAVARLNDQVKAECVLLHFTEVDEQLALKAMDAFIVAHRGKPSSTMMKSTFAHFAGEPWISSERTAQLVARLSEKQKTKEMSR